MNFRLFIASLVFFIFAFLEPASAQVSEVPNKQEYTQQEVSQIQEWRKVILASEVRLNDHLQKVDQRLVRLKFVVVGGLVVLLAFSLILFYIMSSARRCGYFDVDVEHHVGFSREGFARKLRVLYDSAEAVGLSVLKNMKNLAIRLAATVIILLVVLVCSAVSMKLYDMYLMKTVPAPVADADADTPTMRSFNYYPFTSIQIQEYMHEKGKLLWTDHYKDFDVISGEYGFFVDFHLETPPPKKPHEIRIILTGGSGAQGWGGRTNADMIYKKLPLVLMEKLKQDNASCSVDVINLAMGGTHIYQNFIALNKWGHRLSPDAIISFSGHNEIAIPWANKSDGDYGAALVGGLFHVSNYYDSPEWLKKMAKFFPGIVRRTHFGNMVRMAYVNDYASKWQVSYVTNFLDPNAGPMDDAERVKRFSKLTSEITMDNLDQKISTPLYVHSLESMARDFPNIPLFAVFQPLASTPDVYSRLIKDTSDKIQEGGYKNIHSYNLHKLWQDNNYYPGSFLPNDSVHMTNEGQALASKYLGDRLYTFVKQRCAQITSAKKR